MGFSEKIKKGVKTKAAFRCCRCQEIGIEVHHIIPQAQGGSDEFENAAPLCSQCHANFGSNPDKRKELALMRDWWYERVEKKFGKEDPRYAEMESNLSVLLSSQKETSESIVEIKSILAKYLDVLVSQIVPDNANKIISEIVNIGKPPFIPGSPCQMSGQPCPSQKCADGVMDVDPSESGVICNKCGLFIGA